MCANARDSENPTGVILALGFGELANKWSWATGNIDDGPSASDVWEHVAQSSEHVNEFLQGFKTVAQRKLSEPHEALSKLVDAFTIPSSKESARAVKQHEKNVLDVYTPITQVFDDVGLAHEGWLVAVKNTLDLATAKQVHWGLRFLVNDPRAASLHEQGKSIRNAIKDIHAKYAGQMPDLPQELRDKLEELQEIDEAASKEKIARVAHAPAGPSTTAAATDATEGGPSTTAAATNATEGEEAASDGAEGVAGKKRPRPKTKAATKTGPKKKAAKT